MNIVELKEANLVGLALKQKTSNENGQSTIDCENLWHEFHKHKYAEAITNKLGEEIYGVYYNYDGDSSKPFAYFIGYKVKDLSIIPRGLDSVTIAAGKYQKITARGKMPECVTNAWKEVWKSDLSRSYLIDFEIYDERSRDWTNAEVDVYISLK